MIIQLPRPQSGRAFRFGATMPTGVERVEELELYKTIGEIHADVRTLLERDKSHTQRLTKLENRTLIGGAILTTLMTLRDPAGWTALLGMFKG